MRLREAARAQLIYSFRKILKPLIRILLRAGIPYLEFREVIKGAYVEIAVRDGIRGYKGPTRRPGGLHRCAASGRQPVH
jgi:hypothetical protein